LPITPLLASPKLSERCGCEVLLKLENRQMTGSFKERGAWNKLLSLTAEERNNGIIAASAGNHAQGVAYNARQLGIRAKIVMPTGTPLTKIVATQGYGAEVILHGNSYDDAYELAVELGTKDSLTLIHAFDDPLIVAGQGTIAIEIVQDELCADLDMIVCPIGGGGLIGGLATYMKAVRPEVKIIGVEATQCASMAQALQMGQPVKLARGASLADGIAVKRVGQINYNLAKSYVDEVIAVDEDEIARGVLLLLELEKFVAEGSGAVPLAALMTYPQKFVNKKVLLIISGGNIDVNVLDKIITRGLTVAGRIVELKARVPDQPGFLADVLKVFREQQANVLDVSHHRYYSSTPFGFVDVSITLETKGHSHIDRIKQAMSTEGYLLNAKE